jgi:hypothetical protein
MVPFQGATENADMGSGFASSRLRTSMRGGIVIDGDGGNITARMQNAENKQMSIILAKVDAVIAEDAQA